MNLDRAKETLYEEFVFESEMPPTEHKGRHAVINGEAKIARIVGYYHPNKKYLHIMEKK